MQLFQAGKKSTLFIEQMHFKIYSHVFFLTLIKVGSVDPARDFRFLVKQKNIPFGEGEVILLLFLIIFLPVSVLLSFIQVLLNTCCLYCFGCGDPVVLLSLSAAHSKD